MLRLRTVGRHTGEERAAILGSIEDGSNLVTKAMNGWVDPEPAWWLNLLAHPDARFDLVDGSRSVLGRAANEDERLRLWARWAVYNRSSMPTPPCDRGRPRSSSWSHAPIDTSRGPRRRTRTDWSWPCQMLLWRAPQVSGPR